MRIGRGRIGWIVAGAAVIVVAAGLATLGTAFQSAGAPSAGDISARITYFPQPTGPAPTAEVQETPAPTATPAPTVAPIVYVVQEGDTAWDIALKYRMSVDDLMAANPGFNASLLRPGAQLVIPGTGVAPVLVSRPITLDANVSNLVNIDGVNLALRKGPGTTQDLIVRLPAFTPLKILGRTEDSAWLKVKAVDGQEGWVFTLYLDIQPNLSMGSLAILSREVIRPPVRSAAAATKPAPGSTPAPAPTRPVGPTSYPYISGIGARAKAIYTSGQSQGNRPGSVALVGDSNTDNPAFFKPFAWGAYDLAGFLYLQDTIDFFQSSFIHDSPAAIGGFNTTKVLDPANARPGAGCQPGESPLRCEYRLTKPSVALILLGTGDQHTWQGFEQRYRQILDETIALGIVPVLITKADDLESKDNSAPYGYINAIIVRLAGEYGVPLLNFRKVADGLPNRGCISDGFHYNKPPDGQVANFSASYLQYGYNQRNLTALQALDLIRRLVIQT